MMKGAGASVVETGTVVGDGKGEGEDGSVGDGVAGTMVGVEVGSGGGTVCKNGVVNSGKCPAEAKDASALPSRTATSNSPRARAFQRRECREEWVSKGDKLSVSEAMKRGGGAM